MSMLLRRYHEEAPSEPVADEVEKPSGNASQEVWAEYATAQGKDVEGLSRNEIRDLFN